MGPGGVALVSYRAAIGTFNGGRPGRHSPHLHCSSSVKLCTRPLLVTLLLFLLLRAESLPAHGDVERNPGPEIDHDDSPLARRQRNDASTHPSSCDRVRDCTSQPTELQRTSCPGSPLDNTQVRLAVPECQRDGCGCLQQRGSLGFRTCPCIKCRQHGQSLSRSALAKHLRVDHVLGRDYFPEWLKDLQLRLCDKCHRPYAGLQGHRCKPSNLGHQSQSVAGAGAPASVDAVPRPREENATATHPPNTAEAWAACPPDLPWATVDDIDLSTIFQGDVRTLLHLPRNPSIRRTFALGALSQRPNILQIVIGEPSLQALSKNLRQEKNWLKRRRSAKPTCANGGTNCANGGTKQNEIFNFSWPTNKKKKDRRKIKTKRRKSWVRRISFQSSSSVHGGFALVFRFAQRRP